MRLNEQGKAGSTWRGASTAAAVRLTTATKSDSLAELRFQPSVGGARPPGADNVR